MIVFYYRVIKPMFHRLFCISEEDYAIELYKMGKPARLIKYFKRHRKFTQLDHRDSTSPTGRIVYTRDIYDSVMIDSVDISDIRVHEDYFDQVETVRKLKHLISKNIYGV